MRTHTLVLTAMLFMGVAARADAKIVDKTRFKGIQVVASFFGSVPITCADTSTGEFFVNGFLSGADQVFKFHGTPKIDGNAVVVDVFFSNSCTGEFRGASGAVINGLKPPNRNLEFASMEGSTLIQDFFDGAQFPFSLDVELQGFGDISAGRFKEHTKTENTDAGTVTITHSDFANANRSAVATGTVSIDGITLTPEFGFALFNSNANSQLVIETGN
jgi:hypothetical protein